MLKGRTFEKYGWQSSVDDHSSIYRNMAAVYGLHSVVWDGSQNMYLMGLIMTNYTIWR